MKTIKMPKKQMISKGCPKCGQQIPVACKACRCGYSFVKAKKSVPPPVPVENNRRRTQRIRREKPNYYDSLEFEKQVKKTRIRVSECDDDEPPIKVSKTKKRKVKKEEEEEEEQIQSFTGDKQLQCMIILAELNRKMQTVTWKPD